MPKSLTSDVFNVGVELDFGRSALFTINSFIHIYSMFEVSEGRPLMAAFRVSYYV